MDSFVLRWRALWSERVWAPVVVLTLAWSAGAGLALRAVAPELRDGEEATAPWGRSRRSADRIAGGYPHAAGWSFELEETTRTHVLPALVCSNLGEGRRGQVLAYR